MCRGSDHRPTMPQDRALMNLARNSGVLPTSRAWQMLLAISQDAISLKRRECKARVDVVSVIGLGINCSPRQDIIGCRSTQNDESSNERSSLTWEAISARA